MHIFRLRATSGAAAEHGGWLIWFIHWTLMVATHTTLPLVYNRCGRSITNKPPFFFSLKSLKSSSLDRLSEAERLARSICKSRISIFLPRTANPLKSQPFGDAEKVQDGGAEERGRRLRQLFSPAARADKGAHFRCVPAGVVSS